MFTGQSRTVTQPGYHRIRKSYERARHGVDTTPSSPVRKQIIRLAVDIPDGSATRKMAWLFGSTPMMSTPTGNRLRHRPPQTRQRRTSGAGPQRHQVTIANQPEIRSDQLPASTSSASTATSPSPSPHCPTAEPSSGLSTLERSATMEQLLLLAQDQTLGEI